MLTSQTDLVLQNHISFKEYIHKLSRKSKVGQRHHKITFVSDNVLLAPQGVYLKKIDRGARLIFLGLEFLIFLFFWVWKNLSYFFGFVIFMNLFFWV